MCTNLLKKIKDKKVRKYDKSHFLAELGVLNLTYNLKSIKNEKCI
jgi:hypothetical protein